LLKENGLKLFELTFAPSKKTALVFYTRGIKVCLPEDQIGNRQLQWLLAELNNPSQGIISLVRILVFSCKGASETGKKGLEAISGKLDRELRDILGRNQASRAFPEAPGIKIYFSIKDIGKLLREWKKDEHKGFWGPGYYFFSIERGGHQAIRSIFSLEGGVTFTTYVYPACTRLDLKIQEALVGLFANLGKIVLGGVK